MKMKAVKLYFRFVHYSALGPWEEGKISFYLNSSFELP